MRFSRFWCIRSFKATWKTSSSFKESLNASVGSEPKIYVEIHGPYIYICFLFIGIVRNCDQLEVTCLTCFLVVIPERSRGGTSNGKWHFCSPGTTAWIPAAQRIFHVPKPPIRQGRWLVAHQLKLPAVDGWKISLKSSSKIIPSLKLRRCPWKLKVGFDEMSLFGRQFRPSFRYKLSVSWRLLSSQNVDDVFGNKVHPGYEGTMFQ